MSKITLTPIKLESSKNEHKEGINKIYMLGDKEINGIISHYSVEPLRILSHLLKKEQIEYQIETTNSDLWKVEKITMEDKYAEYIEIALKEIMEYRCAFELASGYKEIIRQLPFEEAMRVSNLIMNYGIKSESQKQNDELRSELEWANHNMFNRSIGLRDIQIEETESIIIPTEEKEKRKHLIYTSARGGYNIKTLGYNDSTLDHYCYRDSGKWD